jgi:hypothetical protein
MVVGTSKDVIGCSGKEDESDNMNIYSCMASLMA